MAGEDYIVPQPDGQPVSELNGIVNQTSHFLFREDDGNGNIKRAIWISDAEAYAQTLTFATDDVSDALTDDEEIAPGDMFPNEVGNIKKATLAAILTEINSITNNTAQQLVQANLSQSVALMTPSATTQFVRTKAMQFSTGGANTDAKGHLVWLSRMLDDIEVNVNKDNLFIRMTDEGCLIAAASGSSLTIVLAGNHFAVLCIGMSKDEAYQYLRGNLIL